MKPVEPIYVVDLFPPLSDELQAVLRSLITDEWEVPTVCSPWSVKDVAAHLLGGNLGRLWKRNEDSIPSEIPILDYHELVSLINRENENWVQAARRISPEILIEFLDLTDRHLYDHFKDLDPHEPARISVAWASDSLAPNWLDIAREYTEKWLHQQHIREAVDLPLLTGQAWMAPVLDTFMRGLPRTFRHVKAVDGASVSIEITGEAGGEWSLVGAGINWELFEGMDPDAACKVQMDQDLAWRLFTRGVTPQDARQRVQMEGDTLLGDRVLEMVSIMA